MTARITFLGAAGTVTGSRFLVTTESASVLVDCGLFQGLRDLRDRNWSPFPVPAESIQAVVVSHAHLDHSGYLPALVAQGFSGPVFATDATAALARIVLLDSAHLLAEDAEHARTHGYSKHERPRPLYTSSDVEAALKLFRPVPFGSDVEIAPGIQLAMRRAGHILGSASPLLVADGRRLLFSGDLGRPNHPLLRPPEPPPSADAIVVESTYGNRSHETAPAMSLGQAIRRTVARGGSVVIPAFAVDRTEVVLMELRRLREKGEIPEVPIYVDSPMALAALRIYRTAIRSQTDEIRPELAGNDDVLDPGSLVAVSSVEESKAINHPAWPSIVISASGMATGGRVLHHLAGLLPDPRNTVVLAGYQAVGTRGRDLADGAPTLKIHGRYVPVRAEVVNVPIFSVHADADEVTAWLRQAPAPPDTCFVVHGEPDAANALRQRITDSLGWPAVVPRLGERVSVG